ncbi:hypothetical protein EDB83DRAFT_2524090 [Lactarius deliciosus]|nr:hypothetical protein EDB83DRAFT_2524090 [Lactarius deliciosus]
MPETMTEWQTAARVEAQRARTLASCLPPRKDGPRRPQPMFYTHAAPVPAFAPTIPDGVVPMDVDAATTNTPRYNQRYATPLSDAERERCMCEGRCFRCQQQGHAAIECPHKLRRPSTRPPPAQANATSSAPLPPTAVRTQPASVSTAAALHHLSGLSERARQDAISSLIMMGGSDVDDQDAVVQINTICLNSPPASAYSPDSSNSNNPNNDEDDDVINLTSSDWHPRYPVTIPQNPPRTATPSPVDNGIIDLTDTDLEEWDTHLRPTAPAEDTPKTVVEDDNKPRRGVKTSPWTSVSTLPTPASYKSTATDDTDDDEWALFAPRTPLLTPIPLTCALPTPINDELPPADHGNNNTWDPATPQPPVITMPIPPRNNTTTPDNAVQTVLTSHVDTPVRPRSPLNTSRLLFNAFERPRDPNELATQTPVTPPPARRRNRANAANDTPT